MKRKSIQQTQVTVRKLGQQRVSKKSKISILAETLIQLPLHNFRWPQSRVTSDCVICCFQSLGVISSQQAKNIRAQFTPQNLRTGLKPNEIFAILNYKYGEYHWALTPVSHVKLNIVLEILRPNHAFFLRVVKDPASGQVGGHLVVVVRDPQGNIGLVDPQLKRISYGEEIKTYLQEYNFSYDNYQVITVV